MFRFQSFHMYGIICSAIAVGATSILLIRKLGIKSASGDDIIIHPKKFTKGNVIGGFIFGIGWALTGACPGPLYALIGSGYLAVMVVLLGALAGTYIYGVFRDRLPH
jgi:uncharacterized membrane protein YedE/YeeE